MFEGIKTLIDELGSVDISELKTTPDIKLTPDHYNMLRYFYECGRSSIADIEKVLEYNRVLIHLTDVLDDLEKLELVVYEKNDWIVDTYRLSDKGKQVIKIRKAISE